MKKRIVGILACLTVATSVAAICGCASNGGGSNSGGGGNKPSGGEGDNPVIGTEDSYKIVYNGGTNLTLDLDEESELAWSVTKNNEIVTDVAVDVTVVGDAIKYDEETGKVKALEEGEATLTLSLVDKEAKSVDIKYTVYEYFFSHSLVRGEVNLNNENNATNPRVSLNGGQSCVIAKKQDTKFVFRCTVTNFTNSDNNEAFTAASVIDLQSNQLWIGPKGVKPTQGTYDIYIRNWYKGWNTEVDEKTVAGYSSVQLGEKVGTGRQIEFEFIRDGADYYFNIGGYWGKYTDTKSPDVPTYPGIFSQNLTLQLTNYTVSYTQDDVDTAKASYNDGTKAAAAVAINENKLMLVKGGEQQYTAATYPTGAAAGAITWELDKTQMTAGKDGTTIENGLLHLSDDAEGVVTVIAKIDGTEVTTRKSVIIIDNAAAENDVLTAKGGVQLNQDTGAITFLDLFKEIDGIGADTECQDTDYCAMLKQSVKNDFTLEFNLSGYDMTGTYPKLQVGLGASHNNFYIAYYKDGTCRIEARTRAVKEGAFATGWYNSNDLKTVTGFSATGTNKFKFHVAADGTYEVYVNDVLLTFTGNNDPVILKRDFPAFSSSLPIKFATSGVSAVISDITVTNGNADLKYEKYWYYNGTNISIDEQADGSPMTLKLTNDGWGTRDNYTNRVLITDVLPENYVLEYDAKWQGRTSDSKLVLIMGDWQYNVVNKLVSGDGFSGQIVKGGDWRPEVRAEGEIITNAHVRLERNGNAIRFIVNDVIIAEEANAPVGKNIEFYVYNGTAGDADKTVEIKNITVSAYSKAKIYGLTVNTNTTITDFASADATDINVTVKLDGSVITPADSNLTLAYKLDDPAKASIDTSGAVAKIKGLAEGTVTLTVSLMDGETVLKSVEVEYTVEHVIVTNNYVSVKGGAKLQINGADPNDVTTQDYAIIFPEDKGTVNGVGNDQAYEDTSYAAVLNQKVKGDFSIEFTVSDYKNATNAPKLLLSLGGTHNQFYFCYYPEQDAAYGRNGICRIETFVDTVDSDGSQWAGGNWGETADFAADSATFPDFSKTGSMTYKITVVHGIYHIYMKVNGEFKELVHNAEGGVRTIARRYSDYISEQPIRFATSGASAKVSNIKLEVQGVQDYYMVNTKNVHLYDEATDGADKFDFRITAAASGGDGWRGRDNYMTRVESTQAVGANTTVTFDLNVSKGMSDGKFIIAVGEKQVMICPQTNGFYANINGCGSDWGEGAHPLNLTDVDGAYIFKVKVVRAGGNIALWISTSDDASGNPVYTSIHNLNNAGEAGGLWFAVFNTKSEDATTTFTVSNLKVTNS